MTIEQFRAKYHLLDRVSDGAVETHHAQAAAGLMVMVHFLRGGERQNAALLERIQHLDTDRRQKVLHTVDVDGVTAVVTRFILDLTSFEDWLGVAGGRGASEPGEFTRFFPAPAPPPDLAPPIPSAPGENREPEPDRPMTSTRQGPAAGSRAPEPGEFTRLFSPPAPRPPPPGPSLPEPTAVTPRPTAEPPAPSVAQPPPAIPLPPPPWFRPAGPPTPEIGPPRTSKPAEPGGYTRMIHPHLMPDPPSHQDDPPAFPGHGPARRVGPVGTFGSATSPDTPRYEVDRYRERLAASPPGASANPFPPSAPPPPPPLVPAGPSDFTKVIATSPPPNLGQPPVRPAMPAASSPASNKVLVLALLGVVLAAILFVVIVAIGDGP